MKKFTSPWSNLHTQKYEKIEKIEKKDTFNVSKINMKSGGTTIFNAGITPLTVSVQNGIFASSSENKINLDPGKYQVVFQKDGTIGLGSIEILDSESKKIASSIFWKSYLTIGVSSEKIAPGFHCQYKQLDNCSLQKQKCTKMYSVAEKGHFAYGNYFFGSMLEATQNNGKLNEIVSFGKGQCPKPLKFD